MEKFVPKLETGGEGAEMAPEALGLIEQVKETIAGISNYFKLKIKKVLNTVFDWKNALAGFRIELIRFGEQVRTVVAYKDGIDYPLINNFLTKVFQVEGMPV